MYILLYNKKKKSNMYICTFFDERGKCKLMSCECSKCQALGMWKA